jgi:hypothetical protein
MIPFANNIVTLYNRREGKDTNGRTVVTWHRTAFLNGSWTRKANRVWNGTAVVLSDTIVCRIPEDARYLSPAGWDDLADPAGYFTLAPGDILVRGDVSDVIGTPLSAAALVEKYKRSGAFVIVTAKDNTNLGLPLGHYLAEGV